MTDKIVIAGDQTRYFLDNQEVTEEAYRSRYPIPSSDQSPIVCGIPKWPIVSDGAAVHPKQRAEHERVAAEKGVPTETLKDGRVVFRDRAHRKQYLRAFGFHDRDGGYGD